MNAHIAHAQEPVCEIAQSADSILRVTIGIDPGLCGAIVVLHDGVPRQFADMPTVDRKTSGRNVDAFALAALIRGIRMPAPGAHVFAILEPPSMRPGESATRGQHSGESYGILKGVLASLGIRWCEVRPQVWKKHYGLLKTEKDVARLYAMNRFPRVAQSMVRKKDNGRADALLIGAWGYETEQHAITPELF